MRLDVSHEFLPKRGSMRAARVMDHFGIGFEQGRHVIADGLELPIDAGDVVLFTGASGSGKSSLMRGVADALLRADANEKQSPDAGDECGASNSRVLDIGALELGERILIDALPVEVDEAMHLLSACGLGEAQLMLRTPAELSDGQRYRFRLALGLSQKPWWIVADEFTATLDRTLARVIAFNIRRLANRTGTGFLLATTHEDVIEDLDPDVHVRCRLDGEVSVERRSENLPCTLPPGLSPGFTRSEVESGSAGRGGARVKKKSDLVRGGAVDQRSGQARLAVLRSVALSQPLHRADEVRHAVMAWRRTGGDLRVCVAADVAGAAKPLLRPLGALEPGVDPRDEPATGDALAGGAASHVSGSGTGGGVRAAKLRIVSVAVDRNAGADGAYQSVL
jgi:ABC-type lipoprotein export system ATPase subunit